MQRPIINYIVLGLSLLFESGSWWVAVRSMRAEKGDQSYWQAITRSKDPPKFMVLLEDSAALIGILIALAATWVSVTFHEPRFDGIGSLLIGIVLAAVAIFLAKESKDLLIGERADPAMQQGIISIAQGMDGVLRVNGLLTTQMAPTEVVAALSLEFEDGLTIMQVERIVADMEAAIRKQHPEITSLFVKPQTPQVYQAAVDRIEKGLEPEVPGP
jgi:divalent metal cation (Fe/Co/Zn/Cd) transporter